MSIIVVYESHWGNTASVAKAIADGKEKDITLCVPGKAETEDVLRKLVAGTYSFA